MTSNARKIPTGTKVEIIGRRLHGEILEGPNSRGEYAVLCGALRTWVPLTELSIKGAPTSKTEKPKKKLNNVSNLEESGFSVDLHGMTVADATVALENALERALRDGYSYIDVIHGIGTGTLKKAVAAYAGKSRHVKNLVAKHGNDGISRLYL